MRILAVGLLLIGISSGVFFYGFKLLIKSNEYQHNHMEIVSFCEERIEEIKKYGVRHLNDQRKTEVDEWNEKWGHTSPLLMGEYVPLDPQALLDDYKNRIEDAQWMKDKAEKYELQSYLLIITALVFSYITARYLSKNRRDLARQTWGKATEPRSKKCPFCAEKVKIEAIVCKHCGKDLPVATGEYNARI